MNEHSGTLPTPMIKHALILLGYFTKYAGTSVLLTYNLGIMNLQPDDVHAYLGGNTLQTYLAKNGGILLAISVLVLHASPRYWYMMEDVPAPAVV